MSRDINLAEYADNYDNNILHVDRSFNRRVVWGRGERDRYYEALTRGRAPNPFVMADVTRCLRFSEKAGNESSTSYYKDLLGEGFEFLSLDGQNRGKAIIDLLTNKKEATGTFIDADGQECVVKNKFFKDFPQRLQDKFRTGCQVSIITYEDALLSELPQIFKNIQDGCPLNSQEKRNATATPIAAWVRHHSKQMSPILSKLLNESKMNRMEDDEVVAKMAMILSTQKEYGLSSVEIDKWYDLGDGFYSLNDENIPYKREDLERTEAIFRYFSTVWSKITNKKKFNRKMWWAILLACEWTYDNDYYIIDSVKFFQDINEIDSNLETDSLNQYSNDRKKVMAQGGDPDDVSRENYYFRYSKVPHHATSRKRWKETIVSEIKKAKLDSIRLK